MVTVYLNLANSMMHWVFSQLDSIILTATEGVHCAYACIHFTANRMMYVSE